MNQFARHRSLKTALAVALALASTTASALGLGQIALKSKLGQPLLAEIPIVSDDPAELEQLRAGLASPETFARVGLQPPDAIVANLQFVPALDAAGRPVIRVTSTQPINEPLLTFLIEVDWGQGRLVREYSTLLDSPRTVSAPLQPSIQAPVLAPSGSIVRAPVAVNEDQPAPAEDDIATADELAGEPSDSVPVRDRPIDRREVASPAPMPDVQMDRPDSLVVQRGDSLSQIAGRLDLEVGLDQAMIALLRANPEAFIGGNVNLLKQGAVLRVPEVQQMQAIGRPEARALVRAQVRQWREAQQPVPPPVGQTADGGGIAAKSPQADPSVPVTSGARLAIVPPDASRATRAGTQSGIDAGGEGEMLRQELQQTKETLAARDAELAEMQSRLAELERLQTDQQRLLSMKDTELAAAQSSLAKSQATAPNTDVARDSTLAWFGGGGLLLLALAAGWWMRRRATFTPVFRAPAEKRSLADEFAAGPGPAAAMAPRAAEPVDQGATAAAGEPHAVPAGDSGALPFPGRAHAEPVTAAPAAAPEAPAWHAAPAKANKLATPAIVATSTADAALPGQQRLDLARAYLDLGDHVSARQLLREVAASGEPDDRRQATRMLGELE